MKPDRTQVAWFPSPNIGGVFELGGNTSWMPRISGYVTVWSDAGMTINIETGAMNIQSRMSLEQACRLRDALSDAITRSMWEKSQLQQAEVPA